MASRKPGGPFPCQPFGELHSAKDRENHLAPSNKKEKHRQKQKDKKKKKKKKKKKHRKHKE
jgi:hypothetical protein